MPLLLKRMKKFGTFEVDLRARELRRGGIRVRLQDQPFEILTMMLERPGEVVTREELRERLWPAGTFVDFEHSLNAAVKRLRAALGDDADNPRFVETQHRRGYRFIAPVASSDKGTG
jgi:cholera toxin transcriptional activator